MVVLSVPEECLYKVDSLRQNTRQITTAPHETDIRMAVHWCWINVNNVLSASPGVQEPRRVSLPLSELVGPRQSTKRQRKCGYLVRRLVLLFLVALFDLVSIYLFNFSQLLSLQYPPYIVYTSSSTYSYQHHEFYWLIGANESFLGLLFVASTNTDW